MGILSEGWPPHTDGEKSVRRPARGYNTTIRAPIFYSSKKEKKKRKKEEMVSGVVEIAAIRAKSFAKKIGVHKVINEVSSLQMKKTVIETELDLSSVGHLMVEVRNGLKDIRMFVGLSGG